ncbi:GDP-mannose 4,6-dehydratase [Candidatus Woesearchaeota archaeon]|nr:GDP-mannose 4,6-dehydratase [Candidatus Woesearchaeota archaeon]
MPRNFLSGKKVLVTGGLGFIGSSVAQKAVLHGAEVTIYDACINPYGWNFANIKEVRDSVTVVKADVRDFEKLKQNIMDKDVVFDCAAQVSHTISMTNPFLDLDINCKGPLNLLEACRRFNSTARIIFASSRGVIGHPKKSPVDELHPTDPLDIQGINKLAAEKYYSLYSRVYGLKTCSLRIANAYGPRAQVRTGDYAIVNWVIKKTLCNEEIAVFGDGTQTRDYIYIEDVVDAMILACSSKAAFGDVFMLGSGTETRFIDVIEMIVNLVGKGSITRKPWPPDRKSIEIGNFVSSISKIRNRLGWSPKVSIQDGLRMTIDFYKARLKEYMYSNGH